jgi:D-glycero-alpha-D-manno-heptose-7-phosphate kinase
LLILDQLRCATVESLAIRALPATLPAGAQGQRAHDGRTLLIISRTPFRLSLFGGGTDYPAWYMEHGGAVLGSAIDKYCYLSCRYLPPFFEHRFRVVYSKIENCQTIDEIGHPAVRAVLRLLAVERGLEIHHDGDLPARSGVGSSSAFTVGLLNAVHALHGRMRSQRQLADEGLRVEQEVLREAVGSQDQVFAACGGLNHIVFHPGGGFTVHPLTLPKERVAALSSRLMLFYTGISRTSSRIAESWLPDIGTRGELLWSTRQLVDEALSVLCGSGDLGTLGRLLDTGWQLKRRLAPRVSTGEVDAMYTAARTAGALGGKLTGAGGGGFLLLFVPEGFEDAVRDALRGLLQVPFRLEAPGSQIVFYDVEQDYLDQERRRATHPLRGFREGDTVPPYPDRR